MKAKVELVPIAKVRPNPFRNIERYPIQREKVEQLKTSIRNTHLWATICGRRAGDAVEIAFGHHRRVAAQELHMKEIPIVIDDLDDAAMLKMMADENMQEWGTSAIVEQETVAAVVRAYAEGKIDLTKPPPSARAHQIRNAPSFLQGSGPARAGAHPYTAETIAEFVQWDLSKVQDTLQALEMQEERLVPKEVFEGLSTRQAQAVVREASKRATLAPAGKAKEHATRTAKKVSSALRGGASVQEAREAARAEFVLPTPKKFPGGEAFCVKLANDIGDSLPEAEIRRVISAVADIKPNAVKQVVSALRHLAKRAERFADDVQEAIDKSQVNVSPARRKELA